MKALSEGTDLRELFCTVVVNLHQVGTQPRLGRFRLFAQGAATASSDPLRPLRQLRHYRISDEDRRPRRQPVTRELASLELGGRAWSLGRGDTCQTQTRTSTSIHPPR